MGLLVILSLIYLQLYTGGAVNKNLPMNTAYGFFGIETRDTVETDMYRVAENLKEDEKLPEILDISPMNFSASEETESYTAFWLIHTTKYHYTDYYEAIYVYSGQRRVTAKSK